jgi:hypothetical protein
MRMIRRMAVGLGSIFALALAGGAHLKF